MSLMQAAERTTADYLALLRAVVAIDSESRDIAGVNAIGEYIANLLGEIGYGVRRHPLPDFADCFEISLAGEGSGHILLLGHMDTVFPVGTAAERPLEVHDGIVTGPGVSDMKGGLILAVCALRTLHVLGFRDFESITYLLTPDEEAGSPQSPPICKPIARQADVCLVLERGWPGGYVVSARVGIALLELIVRGREAHAAVAHEGASAIHGLVALLADLYAAEPLPGVRLNVGRVEGGKRATIVPDYARAEIGVRVDDMEAWQRARALLEGLAARVPFPGVLAELRGDLLLPPMPLTRAGHRLVTVAQAEASKLGWELKHRFAPGASDGNHVAGLGVPCLDGLGPEGGNLHCPDEYLALDTVLPRTALLAAIITRLPQEVATLRALAMDTAPPQM